MLKTFVSLLILFFSSSVFCEQPLIEKIPEVGVTRVTLKNGMRLILKPTDFEADEVIIRFFASGGYGSLKQEDRIIGALASGVLWESGLSDLSADQVSVLLYENSVDFSVKIKPFFRLIEGTCDEDGLKTFFKVTNWVFTQPNFTKNGLNEVKLKSKTVFEKKAIDFDNVYEDRFMAINTQNHNAFKPFVFEEMQNVELKKIETVFKQFFSSPQDFVVTIIGDFEIETILPLIDKYLAVIPSKNSSISYNFNHFTFPNKIIEENIPLYSKTGSLSRITFPIKNRVNQDNIREVALACQAIEVRLRTVLTEKFGATYGIDVAYEFPFYPYLYHPWITLQFRSEPEAIAAISKTILAELQSLQNQKHSFLETEIEDAILQQKRSDEFWMHDNYYWSVVLSNYSLWNWDLKNLLTNLSAHSEDTPQKIQNDLKTFFDLNRYTIISSNRK